MVANTTRKSDIVLQSCLMIKAMLEYYFDINIKNITQKGNARTLDLCLDVLVLPTGEYELVDEDDLMYALQNKQISKKQYHEAYIIAHQLMIEIEENFSEVQDKVMHCYNKIYHKSLRNKHKRPFKPKNKHKHHRRKAKVNDNKRICG